MIKKLIKPKYFWTLVLNLLLTAFLLIVLYPFIVAFMGSFKSTIEILTSPELLPKEWNFNNYVEAWTIANFSKFTWNSIWYTVLTVVITVLTSSVNGYAFARGEFRGKKTIFAMFSAMMFISLGTASLYPTLQIMKGLGLNKSLFGLIIKSFFAINIANMYLVRGFIKSLPKELDEAATIDGCGFIGIFFKIILPLLKPMIATLAVLSFSTGWNDYLWPMIVTMSTPDSQPLSVGLRALKDSGDAAASWHLVMAGAMISAIPMTIVYIIFNRYFVKGVAAGAVKG